MEQEAESRVFAPRGRRPLEPPALTRTNALSGAYPPARRRSADEAEGDGRGVEERRARRRPRRSTARARRAGGEDPQITLNGPRSLEREQGTSAEEQRQNRSAGPAATPPDYPRTRSRATCVRHADIPGVSRARERETPRSIRLRPSAGARARARVSSGVTIVWRMDVPARCGRPLENRNPRRYYFIRYRRDLEGATYDLGTALGPAAMLARPAAVYRRTGTTHRLMCRCERGDGRTRPLTFSDYPLPSTDARASKLFMLRARVAAHRAAARLLLLRVTSPSRGPRSMWEVHLAPRAAAAIAGPPGLRLPRAQSR